MAIDTEIKRKSMLTFGGTGDFLSVADGNIDAGDRQVYLGLYAGASLGAPPGGGSVATNHRSSRFHGLQINRVP